MTKGYEENSRQLLLYNEEITQNYDIISELRGNLQNKDTEALAWQKEAEKFKRELEIKEEEFHKYRIEVNFERERDIIKTSEGVLQTQLSEMAKTVSRLQQDNDECKRLAMIN